MSLLIIRLVVAVLTFLLGLFIYRQGRKLFLSAKQVEGSATDAIGLYVVAGICLICVVVNLLTINYDVLSAERCPNCKAYNTASDKYCQECGIWLGGE